MWKAPPVDLYLNVYLFNITNKDEFLAGKEKIKLQEVGPYVYREIMSHENVTFNKNGTVTAIPTHPLEWMPGLSVGDQDNDELYLPHIALLSIAHVVSQKSYLTRLGLNLVIRRTNSEPIVKMSPKEFMFGYSSTLMTLGNQFLPSWITFEKLGLIDRMYDFEGDFETVYTGEDNLADAGLLATYRGSTKIPQWEGKCGNIQNASDGTKFPTSISKDDKLLFFRKSLCRAKTLVMVNETRTSGLRAFVYHFEKNANDNGLINKENSCFCKTEKCLPRGLLDVNGCYYGFPVALSYPHFLDTDPSVSKDVEEGINLVPERHRSYFVIQPESGLPLDLAVRYQINLALGDVSKISNCERFKDVILPMLWTEIRLYTLPEILATRFHLYLNVLPLVQLSAIYLLLLFGILFISLAMYLYVKPTWRNNRLSHSSKGFWIDDDDFDHKEIDLCMNKRLTSNYLPEKRGSMPTKELEVYLNSLVTPLNQDITTIGLHAEHEREEEEEEEAHNYS